MALDPRFVLASDLLSSFWDKDTGLPLAGGVIKFYKDHARTEPKNVYQISGSPPNYTYTNLGSVITLSATGLMQNDDTGQIIILMYFPWEGDLTTSDGTLELYYVTCETDEGVEQWTREGWPNTTDQGDQETNFINFVPNGQFLSHTNVPAVEANQHKAGEITEEITVLAQGGWTFERPPSSTATDIITFEPFGSAVSSPGASPRYFMRAKCTVPSAGDAYKDIRIKFTDVNKFASDTQKYTFAFSGESNGSGSISATLVLIKNFGFNGDPTTEISIGNVTIRTGGFTVSQTTPGFIFGDNIGKVIGSYGDDYIQLALRLPVDSVYDVSITDFILTPGSVIIKDFPPTPDREFAYESITPAIPAYDSSDLYLPAILSPQGLIYDRSVIGDVKYETQTPIYVNSLHPSSNRMLTDGNQYETAEYSPLGIPFGRLQAKYWIASIQTPRYGTGRNYFTSGYPGANQLIISNNSAGVVSDATNSGTTFTVAVIHKGSAGYGCKSYLTDTNVFHIENNSPVAVTEPSAGTSGFTVSVYQTGNGVIPEITAVQPLAAAALAGTYFTFATYDTVTLAEIGYYVWFKVDGTGVDPAVASHTGIEVDLLSTDTDVIVAQKIRTSLNGWEVTTVITVAGSAVPAGSHFTLNSTTTTYYVWYKVDGVGTDPNPGGKGIQVDILAAYTDVQVATKTQGAINSKYFAAPDFSGLFLRNLNNGNAIDTGQRYSIVPGVIGVDTLGTFELSSNQSHSHTYTAGTYPNVLSSGGGHDEPVHDSMTTSDSGGKESRPLNANVNFTLLY